MSIRIMIVEDDDNKRRQITHVIADAFPLASIRTARSYQGGLRAIVGGDIDVVLLDMSMPSFDVTTEDDGGRSQAFAGREILRQMERRKIAVPVIVVTQFDRFGEGDDILTLSELDAQLEQSHSRNYRGAIYYDVAVDVWKHELVQAIEAIVRVGR